MLRKLYGYALYIILRVLGRRNVALVDGWSSYPYVYPYDVVEYEEGEPSVGELGIHECGRELCVHVYLGGNKWHTGAVAEPIARVTRVYVNPMPLVLHGKIHVPTRSIRRKLILLSSDAPRYLI